VGLKWLSGSGAFVEDTVPLSAFYRDSAGDPIGFPRPVVSWSSSNPSVLEIVSETLAVARDTGSAVLSGRTASTPIDTLRVVLEVIPRWHGRLVWSRSPAVGQASGIAVLEFPGREIRQLPDLGYPGDGSGSPYLSSDGRYVAAIASRTTSPTSRRTIYVVDLVTGIKTAPFASLPGNQFAPVWMPGDTLLAFLMEAATGYEVFTARPDGRDLQQRTHLAQVVPPFFDVTPESHLVLELRAIRNYGNNPTNLVEITFAGDTVREITSDSGYEQSVSVSPDGTMIAYQTESHVWVRDRDGSDPRRLLPDVSTLSGFSLRYMASSDSPSWTPDNQFVLLRWEIDPFLRADGLVYELFGEIYAVRLSDGLAIRLTRSHGVDTQPFFR
jgi:hypothetical protein